MKTKSLEQAAKEATQAFINLGNAFAEIKKQDKRSKFEKFIDWVSFKLFGGKSCMPNELKSFI